MAAAASGVILRVVRRSSRGGICLIAGSRMLSVRQKQQLMILFDDIERTDTAYADYSEPHYTYLNRSGRPAFDSIRRLTEDWLAEYPRPHQRELIARLRTSDNVQFQSAFFELYLYHLFRFAGARVTVHPYRGKGSRRPDFRVTFPNARPFLVEAVTVTEDSAADRIASKRLSVVYDVLNRAKSPDFFFHLRHYGLPRTPIPGARIRKAVESWLRDVDYTAVRNAVQGGDYKTPSLEFEHDGCRLQISLFPVSEGRRGAADHRPIGVLGSGVARMVENWTSIRDGIKAKASRYGRLRQPYLVAVNAADQSAEQIDVMQALFGQETVVYDTIDGRMHGEPRLRRTPNGAWAGPKGPVNRRVSGILSVGSLLPWTVAVHRPVIYHNPWARYPLASCMSFLDNQRPVGAQMVLEPGLRLQEVMRLPADWPSELASA